MCLICLKVVSNSSATLLSLQRSSIGDSAEAPERIVSRRKYSNSFFYLLLFSFSLGLFNTSESEYKLYIHDTD